MVCGRAGGSSVGILEGCVARYPVGCGAEEAEESGGGGGRGWEAHLFSPPLLLANAAACCRARLHAAVARCVEARGRHR
jgi:hypothetical protein